MCEDCGLKHAHYGLKGSGSKKRWCSTCAKGQAGETERIYKNKPSFATRVLTLERERTQAGMAGLRGFGNCALRLDCWI